MTRRTATAVLHVLRSAADVDRLSDRELLCRFAEGEDEAAFAALFRRHAGMVLGVCRRALPTVQDAEDACQATFLVLARKARGTRWQPSVANWLHATARKVARNARVAAQRRARREARAAVPEAVAPVDRMTGRELLAALDEELERLPPRYREPLVLCYLEGLTREEAASRLGVPAATVKTRLERGRKRLGAVLTGRGADPGAGLLVLAATSASGASPPRLLDAVLAAAAGSPPDAVAALARSVAGRGLTNRALLAVLLAVGAGVLGIRAWSTTPAAHPPAEEPPAAPVLKAGSAPAEPTLTFAGLVVGPDGQPVAGARVAVVHSVGSAEPWCPTDGAFDPIPAPERTGADGRFRFTVPQARVNHPKYGIPYLALLATAPGYLPGWADGRPGDATLRLAKEDARITGRVVSLEGLPVAGATVRVRVAHAPAAGTLDPWLAALKERKVGAINLEEQYLYPRIDAAALPGVTTMARTDAQGRFELAGYGKDRVLNALIEGPTIASREVRFVTRPMTTLLYPEQMNPDIPDALPYYGTTAVHAAAPTRPVAGVVRDRATNRPVAGVLVLSFTLAPHPRNGDKFVARTRSGTDGRFTLVGMPKGVGNSILVVPDDGQPYTALFYEVPDPPGFGPVPLDVGLVRGMWIEGTVTDQRSGKPVRHAEVEYHPDAFGNRTIVAVPGLGESYQDKGRFFPAVTGPDGTFRVLGLPGKGYVTAQTDANEYLPAIDRVGEGGSQSASVPTLPYGMNAQGLHAVYPVDVPEGIEVLRRPVTFDPGLAFTVRLVGPDGSPVAGAESFGRRCWAGWEPEAGPGRHRIDAYNPYKPRVVLFRHRAKNLFGELTVPADFAGPTRTVTLRPGVTAIGRLVDEDGTPRAGVPVGLAFRRGGRGAWSSFLPERESVTTDAAGRFRVVGLVPGFEYTVEVGGTSVRNFTVAPTAAGEQDAGDVPLPRREK